MKITLLLALALFPMQALLAGDFKKEQEVIAGQIEGLAGYEGKITVFSLEPTLEQGSGLFHGYPILGSAELIEKVDREALLKALATSVRESNGDPFACFTPRHGLRFSKDGETIDIVICFQCESSRAHGFRFKGFLQTSSAQPAFDKLLRENGAKIPEDKKEANKAEMATPRKPSD